MTKQWIDEGKRRWCWLELGSAAVMLQEFWKDGDHRNVIDGPGGAGVAVNFIRKEALAIFRELKSRSVDAKRPFVGNAVWVTEVTAPDGYHLFFESPTDAPEESVLQE